MYRHSRKLAKELFSSSMGKERLANLVLAVQEFMDEGDFTETAFRHSKISAVITTNHNISISMVPFRQQTSDVNYYRISIYAPLLSKNNPLVQNYKRDMLSNEDMDTLRFIKKHKKLNGTVDLMTGRVDGVLSEINCRMLVTANYFSSGMYTADEVAEQITHEVAHILLYFACLVDVVSYNYTIVHSLDRILGFTDKKLKLNFIEDINNELGINYDADVLATITDRESLYNIMITETAMCRRSETGSETYANKSWEKLADNFVTRMGGGSALASALIKDDMRHNPLLRKSDYNPSSFHYVSEAAKVLFTVVGAATMSVGWTVSLASIIAIVVQSNNENGDVHDKPEERLKRIELGIIDRLKDKSLAIEDREDTLSQLKVVRCSIKDIKDKPTVIRFISRLITGAYWGKGKADRKAEEYMLELEKLNSNPLFAVRSQFGDTQ